VGQAWRRGGAALLSLVVGAAAQDTPDDPAQTARRHCDRPGDAVAVRWRCGRRGADPAAASRRLPRRRRRGRRPGAHIDGGDPRGHTARHAKVPEPRGSGAGRARGAVSGPSALGRDRGRSVPVSGVAEPGRGAMGRLGAAGRGHEGPGGAVRDGLPRRAGRAHVWRGAVQTARAHAGRGAVGPGRPRVASADAQRV